MSDDDLLDEIRERFTYATEQWQDIRDEAKTDMLCVAGQVWEAMDPAGAKQRREANRPMLALDELAQFHNQIVNDVRANPRAIKFSAVGNGANDTGAEFYANKAREIEYRSHAANCYSTAFQNCVERSYGWVRVNTRYSDPRSFDQDIWIEAIPNPDMVLADPDALSPDSSDMRYLFFYESRSVKDFKKDFPKAKVTDFNAKTTALAPDWFRGGDGVLRILISEYWTIENKERTLLRIVGPDGQPQDGYEDELTEKPFKGKVLNSRTVKEPTVMQYITNGIEILKRTPWPGKMIPFASCFGKVLYVDDGAGAERRILSLTRLARDPYMLYCYYRTCEAELVGMTPKFPYFIYENQMSPEELIQLQKSLHEPIAVVKVKAVIEGLPPGQILGFPSRQPYEPPLQALEIGAEAARRSIQAAMGISNLPTAAQRHNEKSGVALQQIKSEQQTGAFHFGDHLDYMIRQVGVIIEDLMDHIHDTMRQTGIRKPDDKSAVVTINDPMQPQGPKTAGDYLVTVSSGPAADSQRDAVNDFFGSLSQNPEVMQRAGDLVIRLKGRFNNLGPLVDELADRLAPPGLQPKEGEEPTPQQLKQQVMQSKQQMAQMGEHLKQATMIIQTKQTEADGHFKVAKMQAETNTLLQLTLKKMDVAGKIEAARITAAKQSADLAAEDREERIALNVDSHNQEMDRTHEAAMAEMQHQQATQQADQAADHASQAQQDGLQGQAALAQQGQDHALEQQANEPADDDGA